MNEHVNRWIKVKMTKRTGDGFYMANQCPICDAESVVQTNACSNCGSILKGYDAYCTTCKYFPCKFTKKKKCKACPMRKGRNGECICNNRKSGDLCPYYEAAD